MSGYIDLEILDVTYLYMKYTSHSGEKGSFTRDAQLDVYLPEFTVDGELLNKVTLLFDSQGHERITQTFIIDNTLYHQLDVGDLEQWLVAVKMNDAHLLVPDSIAQKYSSHTIGIYGNPQV